MIKQENLDGSPFNEGREIIKRIVEKRADLNLFEEGILEFMIKKQAVRYGIYSMLFLIPRGLQDAVI